MKNSAPTKWILPVMLAGALGGCLNTSPVTDARRFFVLEPGPASYETISVEEVDTVVGLKPIKLPAYLHDNRIVVRQSETEIGYAVMVQWGEPLGHGLQRVIRGNLDAALEDSVVIEAPWRREGVDYQIDIRFHRCDVDSSGRAIIDAEWICSQADDPSKAVFGEDSITKTGPDPADDPGGAVTTLSTGIYELSLKVAKSVRACIDGVEQSK